MILITILLFLKVTVRDSDARTGGVHAPLAITVFCTMGALWISTIISWVAAYSAQVVISALIASSLSNTTVERGRAVHAFQWIIFSLLLGLTLLAQAVIFPGILPKMSTLCSVYPEDG